MVTRIEAALLRGLDKENIEYYYQPIFNTATKQIDKAELLLRVNNGADGYFDTETLVGAAEEMGLIDEMDRQALICACKVLPEFKTHGIKELSLNLSPAACGAKRLIDEVTQILEETGTEPSSICFEITEAVKMLHETRLFSILHKLHETGVKLAMDDYGKGHSNLQRMINVPFNTLKMDKSIIWGMDLGGMAEAVLDNTIRFAIENGITVVAEGVETSQQVEFLTQVGCHYLQGYHFGKPMKKEALFQVAAQYRAALTLDTCACP